MYVEDVAMEESFFSNVCVLSQIQPKANHTNNPNPYVHHPRVKNKPYETSTALVTTQTSLRK